MQWFVLLGTAFFILLVASLSFVASRYKRCPSDKILVIYGKVGRGQSARCIHGGGAFIWPLIQDYAFMRLTPMTISIPLQNALSMQNIRINVPSTFTIGISVDPAVMNNAAERLLHLEVRDIEEMAKEIIFGQLRLTVASLTIEQINQDRESFLEAIRKNVEPELNKIGLYLINVNITDITDESDYIDSIGKKAAAEAINQAKIDVAQQDKLGAISHSGPARDGPSRSPKTPRPRRGRRPKRTGASTMQQQGDDGLGGQAAANPTRDQGWPKTWLRREGQEGGRSGQARLRLRPGGRRGSRREHRQGAHRRRGRRAGRQAGRRAAARRSRPPRGPGRDSEGPVSRRAGAPHRRRGGQTGNLQKEDRDRRRSPGRTPPPRGQGRGRRHPAQVRGRSQGHPPGVGVQAQGYSSLVKS
ncbi:flotillin family protein [bacterium]|nr:flotillin family protein [bacterium]